MSAEKEWDELIDRQLYGELSDRDREDLAELLDTNEQARRYFVQQAEWETELSEALSQSRPREVNSLSTSLSRRATDWVLTPARILLAIAAVVIMLLSAAVYRQAADSDRGIVTIKGLSGPLMWTGDGGRVVTELNAETDLRGGTIEGLAPDSWIDLEFDDGSMITLSGNSMLTFSEHSQKELHVREGNVSANVKPQPANRPMLVHTRNALLEVLGTQFEIEAELASTMLNVTEGKVRMKRLSDGASALVPAKHRLIAAADLNMSPVLVPDSVDRWKSSLQSGPRGTFGKWFPKTADDRARLRAIPYITDRNATIYTSSMRVSHGDQAPVLLQPGARIRVSGHLQSKHLVYFGITVRHQGGEFAGRFQTIRPADDFSNDADFEFVVDAKALSLDPSLTKMSSKLPVSPMGLVVDSVWCHTLYDPAGLEITGVELMPPMEDTL